MSEDKFQVFLAALQRHAKYKAAFYTSNDSKSSDFWLKSLYEEAGEVTTDFNRERWYGVIVECLDTAHAAMRLALSIEDSLYVLEHTNKSS